MVMGIPTVKREKQSYLLNTLSSLLFSLTQTHRQELLIIVFIAEVTHTYTHIGTYGSKILFESCSVNVNFEYI